MEVVQNTLNKVNTENKSLLDRINRTDQSVATTMRSLKARKNELQLQVESLKHENTLLKSKSKTKDKKSSKNDKLVKETDNVKAAEAAHLQENLRSAHSRMSELELERQEYARKLQESEGLLYDLQRALAQANDLAMQKSLEGTKTRRALEKKVEKLVSENTDLKRKIFFTSGNSGNVSPTSLFSASPVSSRKLPDDANRKASLPITIHDNTINSTWINTSNFAAHPHGRYSSVNSDQTPTTPLPESPRLNASRQAERDLSQQLRELLDLTNDLTAVREEFLEDQKSLISEESTAPPIPPPPPNYDTDRGYVR